MKRLLLILLSLLLTGCTYLGATEDILISSPDEISVSSFEPNNYTPAITTTAVTTTVSDGATDIPQNTNGTDNSNPVGTTASKTESSTPALSHLILNTSSKKIHYFDNCSYANRMKDENREVVEASMEDALLVEEYTVCSWCAKKRG